MSEILPALIGFVIPSIWLLIQLRWHIRIQRWYYTNINDPYGLAVPSLLIIVLPFILSYLVQNQKLISIALADVSGSPLAIIFTSSLTAIGIYIVNSKINQAKDRKELESIAKMTFIYLNNEASEIQNCINTLQEVIKMGVEQNSILELTTQTQTSLSLLRLKTVGSEKQIINSLIDRTSSLPDYMFYRITWYFKAVSVLIYLLRQIEALYPEPLENDELTTEDEPYRVYSYEQKIEEIDQDSEDINACNLSIANLYSGLLKNAYESAVLAFLHSIIIRLHIQNEIYEMYPEFFTIDIWQGMIDDLVVYCQELSGFGNDSTVKFIKSDLEFFLGIAI